MSAEVGHSDDNRWVPFYQFVLIDITHTKIILVIISPNATIWCDKIWLHANTPLSNSILILLPSNYAKLNYFCRWCGDVQHTQRNKSGVDVLNHQPTFLITWSSSKKDGNELLKIKLKECAKYAMQFVFYKLQSRQHTTPVQLFARNTFDSRDAVNVWRQNGTG